MSNYLNYRLMSLILISTLLFACASEDKPNAENDLPEERVFLKAYVSEEARVDLNVENSIDIRLTRELEDSTEEEVNLVLTWDDDSFILSDNLGTEISLEYDATALEAGETTLKFVDPVSMRNVEVTVELIRETPSFVEALIENGPEIDLNINESVELNLIRTLSDNTEQRSIFILTSEAGQLTLKDKASDVAITLTYDTETLVNSRASVEFTDPVSARKVILAVELIVETPVPVVSEVSVQGGKALIDLNESISIELNLIRKFTDNTERTLILVLVWETDKLTLKDKTSGAMIALSYDAGALGNGEASVSFNDLLSGQEVIFVVELIQKNTPDPVVTQVQIQGNTALIDLNENTVTELSLIRKFDDDTEQAVMLILSWELNKLTLKEKVSGAMIALIYDAVALANGGASVTFNDLLSAQEVIFTIELIQKDIPDPVVTQVQIQGNTALIDLNKNVAAELNLIRKFDDDTEQTVALILAWEINKLTLKEKVSGTTIALAYDAGALASGEASVTFNDLLSAQEVIFTIELIQKDIPDPVVTQAQIQGNTALIDLHENTVTELSLIRKFDDDTEQTMALVLAWELDKLTLKDKASDDIIPLSYSEEDRAVGNTTVMFEDPVSKLNVNFELTFIDISVTQVTIESHALTIFEGNTLQLLVKLTYSNGDVKFNVFDSVKCQSMSASISVTAECLVSANSAGLATIELVMEEGNAELKGSEIEVIAPPTFGELSEGLSSTFPVFIPASATIVHYEIRNAIVGETYKVVLSGAFLPSRLKLYVEPSPVAINGCSNFLFFGVLDERVACGVKAESEKFYIRITTPFVSYSAEAEISVTVDDDILLFDGPVKAETSSFYRDNYDFADLSLGELRNGHVPANSSGSNVSRYFSNEELGMVPDLSGNGDYTVLITFDSLSFAEESAIIRWFVSDSISLFPTEQCKPVRDLSNANKLTCKIENLGQTDLFVEVLGNPPSNSTAGDGEISYTIMLDHSLRD